MDLLTDEQLEFSATVDNNRMNRERQAFGTNSYEKDLRFNPVELLSERLLSREPVSWMDLCCGKGNALIQAGAFFEKKKRCDAVVLEGLDLVGMFSEKPQSLDFLTLTQGSATTWQPQKKYDLITCVHGLHYIGDKLKVICTALQSLKPEGIFVANLDLNNILIPGKPDFSRDLKKLFRKNGLFYSKNHVLSCFSHTCPDFGLAYLGADDQAGANYTRQEAVNSFYIKNYA